MIITLIAKNVFFKLVVARKLQQIEMKKKLNCKAGVSQVELQLLKR